jgi:hypothetical protein
MTFQVTRLTRWGNSIGDHSMPGTRESPADVDGRQVPPDLRDMARIELFKPQSRVMLPTSPDHNV